MSNNGVQRTAVCFSGQPRTWRKCLESWEEYLIGDEVELFCHLWDYNTLPNPVLAGQPPINELVHPAEIDELLSCLSPRAYKIESSREFAPMVSNQALSNPSYLSQFYGVHCASTLKKDYEIAGGFQYDRVIRIRYDSHLFSTVLYTPVSDNTMECFHYGWDAVTHRGRVGDGFWMADSRTYDIISDFYLNCGYIDGSGFEPGTGPEQIFFHYIKKNNIKLNRNYWDIKLDRLGEQYSYSKDRNGFETW